MIKTKRKGFTMTDFFVVVIAVLFFIMMFMKFRDSPTSSHITSRLSNIRTAALTYSTNNINKFDKDYNAPVTSSDIASYLNFSQITWEVDKDKMDGYGVANVNGTLYVYCDLSNPNVTGKEEFAIGNALSNAQKDSNFEFATYCDATTCRDLGEGTYSQNPAFKFIVMKVRKIY